MYKMSSENSKEMKTINVSFVKKDSLPTYWPSSENIYFDEKGVYIAIDLTALDISKSTSVANSDSKKNAKNFELQNALEDKRDVLLKVQKAAKKILALGYLNINLINSDYASWDEELAHAFAIGFRDLKKKTKLSCESLKGNNSFWNEEAIISWVRDTIDLPANKLNPYSFGDELTKLAHIVNNDSFSIKCLKEEDLVTNNLVGIATVGNGSKNKPCLYEIEWNPLKDSKVKFGLVGKGITFDTGGYSLKPSELMRSMHSDMGGAATVAGVIALAAIKNFNHHVKAYLCCAENVVSGSAMKVGDIITYPNNVSVEIANTDAEGRLVLADGLIKASSEAEYIIDAATLTGAAKVAVGRDYNAVLSLNRVLANTFVDSATEKFEYAWELPFAKMHLGICSSSVADITNSASGDGIPGATSAAVFLSHFVSDTNKWIHIDLSASYQKVANSAYNVGGKGHGVRSIMHYMEKIAS